MRIIFDAYWWVHGPPSLRHALREIVLAWHNGYPDDELTLVARSRDAVEASWEVPLGIELEFSSHWPQAFLATHAVARYAAATHADAVLTHNFAAKVPCVSAIYLHDVLFRTNPEWFTPLERLYFSLMTRWVRRADIVFTSSKTEASRIERESEARLVLPVGLGLSTELTSRRAQVEPDDSLRPGSYLLTVGRLNARKNLERTIVAALESGLSLGEGFGMPPVEAAHFGAPILVSDLPVFHENLGERAAYVDPTDITAIAAAMRKAVSAPGQHDAEELAAQHDWSATVTAMRSAIVEQNKLAVA
jgi:glycosyltransferase involved in cell wall biosynthesis